MENAILRAQSAVAWSLPFFLAIFVLFEGGNQPLAWTLAAAAIILLFFMQVIIDSVSVRASGLNRLWLPALLYLLVLGWGVAQRAPEMPSAWAHPVWSFSVPETIGFDESEGQSETPQVADGLLEGGDASENRAPDETEAESPVGFAAGSPLSPDRSDGLSFPTQLSQHVEKKPVISADPEQGRHVLLRLLTYAMVFWIAVRSAQDAKRAGALVRALALFSTGLALFGVYAVISGSNPLLGDAASGVVSASFVNRNNYATFAIFGALANLAAFMTAARKAEQGRANPVLGFIEGFFSGSWIWILGFIVCAGAMLMTQSRAGAAAAAVGVVVFLLACRSRGSVASFGPVVMVGFVGAVLAVTGSTGVLERFLNQSADARFAIYPRVVEAIGDRTYLGHGFGSFHDAFRPYVPLESAAGAWDMAHNSYLENAFEFGVPAAILFYLALLLIGLRLLRGIQQRRRSRNILAFAFACFCVAAFHALFDFSLQMPALAAIFAWILGIGYAQSFREDELSAISSRRRQRRLDGF